MSWHINQSSHNVITNQYLRQKNPDYKDWEITSLFYSAVHLVNSYFILIKQKIPRSHKTRNRWVENELQQIFDEYDSLYWLSRRSRYDTEHQNLTSDEEKEAQQCFLAVQQFILEELKKAGHVQ